MGIRTQVTFDAVDPGRLSAFWALALDYRVEEPPAGYQTWEAFALEQGIPRERWNDYSAVVDPEGRGPRLFFQRVPEPKTAKNRVHLDVNAGGGRDVPADERHERADRHVERLIEAGATKLRLFDEPHGRFVVMQDPEGNEFCVQ